MLSAGANTDRASKPPSLHAAVLLVVLFVVDLHTNYCRYEVQIKEQSKHYAKQNIKPVPYARFPGDNVPLKDAGNVLFNENAHELESAETFTLQSQKKQTTSKREVTHPKRPASQSVTKQPPSPKPKDLPSSKPNKPPVSPKPSQKLTLPLRKRRTSQSTRSLASHPPANSRRKKQTTQCME